MAQVNIDEYLKRLIPTVNDKLNEFLPAYLDNTWLKSALGEARYAYDKDSVSEAISEPLREFLSRGGKRWRPALMLLCNEAVGGDPNKVIDFVVLPELIHNGTLVVDDIEDNALVRRGKKALHLMYGTDIAVNAGNAAYFIPLKLLYSDKDCSTEKIVKKCKIYDLIAEELARLHFGQAMDIYWHKGKKKDISEEAYLQMCAYKTGTLARLAAKLGAILGDAPDNLVEALGKYGESLGIGFQIQDDIFSLKPSKEWAKNYGEDITEGKRSLMIIKVLKECNVEEEGKLMSLLDKHTTDKAEIDWCVQLIEKYDGFNYAKRRAVEILEKAWADIDFILPSSKAKDVLKGFVSYMVEREV